jgi:hypothetical protein
MPYAANDFTRRRCSSVGVNVGLAILVVPINANLFLTE